MNYVHCSSDDGHFNEHIQRVGSFFFLVFFLGCVAHLGYCFRLFGSGSVGLLGFLGTMRIFWFQEF